MNFVVGVLVFFSSGCVSSDAAPGSADTLASQPFETIVSDVRRLPLRPSGAGISDPVTSELVSGLVVRQNEIVVVDKQRAEIKVFDRKLGTLLRVMASPGDQPGSFRQPSYVAELDAGLFVVLDTRRYVLSFRDPSGRFMREASVPRGLYGGLIALPRERRLVLVGDISEGRGRILGHDLHEIDYAGNVLESYASSARTRSAWEETFRTLFAAARGDSIVITGALNSRRLRFVDRRSRSTAYRQFGSGIFSPLRWPPDRELAQHDPRMSAAQRVTAWSRKQELMNAAFPLDEGRLLVRLRAFDGDGGRLYVYALADDSGRTLSLSTRTRHRVVHAVADTVYWISHDEDSVLLGSGVVGFATTHKGLATAEFNR